VYLPAFGRSGGSTKAQKQVTLPPINLANEITSRLSGKHSTQLAIGNYFIPCIIGRMLVVTQGMTVFELGAVTNRVSVHSIALPTTQLRHRYFGGEKHV
jgi:hypothetical protein